jgi:putative radical SAM enzyme (TIGR03279 family)
VVVKILEVAPGSPLFGYIRPGYSLVSINGHAVRDTIDFRFRIADDRVKMVFADRGGRKLDFTFDSVSDLDLGLTLDDQKVLVCKNDCIFCFVRQQPKGMRRALYIKDEDYRLSFTHGNFVTLSNTTEEDMMRIIEQRLSPLYVSVHATDDTLRRCMLKNEKLAPILPKLRKLAENGITLHTQVVLCPGVNDGAQLEKTIEDLAALYPGVESLGVVPVGLTRYRDKLPRLRTYGRKEAGQIIDFVQRQQRRFLKSVGSRFVWCADEFYVAAGRAFPPRSTYESMSQFENGIGMAREFITLFNRRRAGLKKSRSRRRISFLTGRSAYPFLRTEIAPYLKDSLGMRVLMRSVENRFWGPLVTVSGLLTGRDLASAGRSIKMQTDLFVLPPNCLNSDNLFLDNLSLEEFRSRVGRQVLVGSYDLAATIREAAA